MGSKKPEKNKTSRSGDSYRRTGWRRWGRFKKSEEGATAVEFALVAGPFFMLVMGIFEVSLNYFADRLLNVGVDRVARQIRTGEIRGSTHSSAQFKQALCQQDIMFLFDCNGLIIDVQEVAEFKETPTFKDDDGELVSDDFGFAPGGRSTINVVRAYYHWPTVINWADGFGVPAFGTDKRLIVGTAAFMNEPYSGS